MSATTQAAFDAAKTVSDAAQQRLQRALEKQQNPGPNDNAYLVNQEVADAMAAASKAAGELATAGRAHDESEAKQNKPDQGVTGRNDSKARENDALAQYNTAKANAADADRRIEDDKSRSEDELNAEREWNKTSPNGSHVWETNAERDKRQNEGAMQQADAAYKNITGVAIANNQNAQAGEAGARAAKTAGADTDLVNSQTRRNNLESDLFQETSEDRKEQLRAQIREINAHIDELTGHAGLEKSQSALADAQARLTSSQATLSELQAQVAQDTQGDQEDEIHQKAEQARQQVELDKQNVQLAQANVDAIRSQTAQRGQGALYGVNDRIADVRDQVAQGNISPADGQRMISQLINQDIQGGPTEATAQRGQDLSYDASEDTNAASRAATVTGILNNIIAQAAPGSGQDLADGLTALMQIYGLQPGKIVGDRDMPSQYQYTGDSQDLPNPTSINAQMASPWPDPNDIHPVVAASQAIHAVAAATQGLPVAPPAPAAPATTDVASSTTGGPSNADQQVRANDDGTMTIGGVNVGSPVQWAAQQARQNALNGVTPSGVIAPPPTPAPTADATTTPDSSPAQQTPGPDMAALMDTIQQHLAAARNAAAQATAAPPDQSQSDTNQAQDETPTSTDDQNDAPVPASATMRGATPDDVRALWGGASTPQEAAAA